MMSFITENIGTILVGLALAGILTAIVFKIVRDRKKGKCAGCDLGCGGCPGRSGCDTK